VVHRKIKVMAAIRLTMDVFLSGELLTGMNLKGSNIMF
jgi:hypothetical protein